MPAIIAICRSSSEGLRIARTEEDRRKTDAASMRGELPPQEDDSVNTQTQEKRCAPPVLLRQIFYGAIRPLDTADSIW